MDAELSTRQRSTPHTHTPDATGPSWRKPIPQPRDHAQSTLLTLLVGGAVVLAVLWQQSTLLRTHRFSWPALLLSAAFGLLAWRLRAATPPAAFMGAAICLLLVQPGMHTAAGAARADSSTSSNLLRASGTHALITLFVLTFLATRFGRARKEQQGLAERRTGRRAAQVLANLGIAALFAATGHLLAALAALAEATADTISSEVGQALAGPTWLLTTGRRVPAGTDGGISLAGTLAGCIAALVLAGVACLTLQQSALGTILLLAGICGLAFDSLLGATIERRGWIGNDLVNLLSTLAAALAAMLLEHLHRATP